MKRELELFVLEHLLSVLKGLDFSSQSHKRKTKSKRLND